ncbi:MAG: hypothetical protein AB7I27_02975 [Bacteriovoracaceae bacterium]
MKRNSFLFVFLIVLLIGTYLFQEKKAERDYQESKVKDHLFVGEIKSLVLPKVQALKKDEQWWWGDLLLSHNSFKQIEKKLYQIKKIKDVQGEWNSFFSHPFKFKVNNEIWTLGDLTLDKQGFYIARDKKIMVAEIDGESTELTTNPDEVAEIKLRELEGLLSKNLSDLKETQFFRFYPRLPSEKVMVDTDGNLEYELNFKDNMTSPSPIPGISVHQNLKSKFLSLLTQMTIRDEIPYSEKLKFKKMGHLTFMAKDNDKVTWELWLKGKDSADAIIIDPKLKRSFLMVGGTLKVFFVQLQDYWDKKVIPPKEFKFFTRLNAVIYQGNKSEVVSIINKEPLEFESEKFKVKSDNLRELFQLIFNLGDRDQADRVSLLNKSERKQLLNSNLLKIEVMGQEIIAWRKKEEIILVNLTQGFKAHFSFANENFHANFQDVLE